jgi:hypothetical protein
MKFKRLIRTIFVAALAVVATACSDDDKNKIDTGVPFDAAQPITITSFTPESGGYQDQIIVKGSNFGNDKSIVDLKIGGKDAVLVNVLSDRLYAFVPSGAYSGDVELIITPQEGGKSYSAVAPMKFNYERKTVVGTLCGYQNQQDDQGEVWGSFDITTGFNAEGCMTFDPLYPNRLYIAYDRGDGFIAELDLDARTNTRILSANKFGNKRLRNIAFSLDGKYMLVSTDRDDAGTKSTSVWIITRSADGTFSDKSSCQPLVAYKQCNGVAVHPINGEVYFNSYEQGQLFRMDLNDYLTSLLPSEEGEEKKPWTGYLDDGAFRELYKIQDPSYEFQITIHPSGKYAYLTVINRSYILRTDYDENTKQFTTPYTVVGYNGQGGWVDAVGTNARVSRPYQGVFVKNPEYEAEGREDIYDYYFCDCTNFCVRYITPDGLVRTYAGRAPSTNGNIWGTEDGDLRQAARFRDVTGIAYDEKNEMFYVLDHNNRRIRYIGKEMENAIEIPDVEETPEEGEETTED